MAGQPPQRTFSFDPDDKSVLQPPGYENTQTQRRNDYVQHFTTHNDSQFSPVDMTSPVSRAHSVSPPNGPPAPPRHGTHPSQTAGTAFQDFQSQRQYGAQPASQAPAYQQNVSPGGRKPVPTGSLAGFQQRPNATQYHQSEQPPGVPPHYPQIPVLEQPLRRGSLTTPGSDNMSERAAGGGIAGIAFGVANHNERESGIQALRGAELSDRNRGPGSSGPSERHYQERPTYEPSHAPGARGDGAAYMPPRREYDSQSSLAGLTAAAAPPAISSPPRNFVQPPDAGMRRSPQRNSNLDHYSEHPYGVYNPRDRLMPEAQFNPDEIADDGEEDFPQYHPKRSSMLSLGRGNGSANHLPAAAGVGAAAGAAAAVGGPFGHFGGKRDSSGQYSSLPPQGGGPAGSSGNLAYPPPEKSMWLDSQDKGNKKMKWIVGGIIVLIVLLAIAGGIVGGVLGSKHKSSAGGETAQQDDGSGDLDINSAQIKQLMNNPNLHKVFMGMDYTPLNTQYPACLTNKPSQNNVTRDMAMLSQLTNVVRLYGTDCNQTEMVLHAIDKLQLKSMKVWLGVWLDTNTTTNDRQMSQMYSILDQYGATPFAGLIVGNEIMFRQDMTVTQLATVLQNVKSNLTSKSINLPLATSDLGDAWSSNPSLAAYVDVVMSNIHPFFAGIPVAQAAAWTWNFWQTHDAVLTAGTSKTQAISEVGWPSAGGQLCTNDGTPIPCPDKTSGSIAGIDEMNQFMGDFVCQSLANGTNYFWFEAFDEPWKIQYDTKTEQWEDKWGLLTVDRDLKTGLTIPNCGGKTVPS